MELRGKSISYGSYKKRQNIKKEEQLISEIKDIEQNYTDTNSEQYLALKDELKELEDNKLKAFMIRSKAKWVTYGEKPTKYFCGLEKQNIVTKTIRKLINKDGEEIVEQDNILNEIKSFYANLYKSNDSNLKNESLDTYFRDIITPCLSNEESNCLEGAITYEEASIALKNMKNNKSPGTTGFGADFFKCFWKKIGPFVVRYLNEAFDLNKLSITQTQGIITCIPKGNKSRHLLKNWRPITLLNTIYKIGTACISNRIKPFLLKLIHSDQTGFLKGRYIGENTRLIYDIMHYTEQNNIPGMILLIDFEKAFDSLSWEFVSRTLTFFNFGPSIHKWFQIFYKDAKSAISQCGFLSDFFKVERGCRQGDPLSCYIFILCAEILSIKIRSDTNIKGITINGKEYKLSQYADDTSILLDGSSDSLNSVLDLLTDFSYVSGLNVNYEKTKIVWIGKEKYSSNTIKTKWKLIWNEVQFQMLGVHFHVDLDKMHYLNFEPKLDEISNTLKKWNRRILTPLGKVTIIKSLLIAKLNHLFLSLPNPSREYIKKLDSMLYNFVWCGKDKIKRPIIVKEYFEGGLNMINVNAFIDALKTTWIKRLIFNSGGWAEIIKCEINMEKLCCTGKHYYENLANTCTNKFWADTFKAFSNLIYKLEIENEYSGDYPLFYNHNILVGTQSFFLKSWFQAGVFSLSDLFDDGKILNCDGFNEKFNLKANILTYQGTLLSVKKFLFKANIKPKNIRNTLRPYLSPYLKVLLHDKNGAKYMYKILNINHDVPVCKNTWVRKIPNLSNLSNNDWKSIFNNPFSITRDTTIQWFQYRIIHRILGTNSFLHMIKYKETALCSFCNKEEETIEHLFWQCEFTNKIIKSTFLIKNIPMNFLNLEQMLFGYIGHTQIESAMNILLILTKMYIFNCKNNKIIVTENGLKRYFTFRLKILKNSELQTQSVREFKNKWKGLDCIVDINEVLNE